MLQNFCFCKFFVFVNLPFVCYKPKKLTDLVIMYYLLALCLKEQKSIQSPYVSLLCQIMSQTIRHIKQDLRKVSDMDFQGL